MGPNNPMRLTTWTILIVLPAVLCSIGCQGGSPRQRTLPEQLAHAHGTRLWQTRPALAGDIHVETLNNLSYFDAQFTYEIRTGRVRMQLIDDTILVHDGRQVWVSPASARIDHALFAALAWIHYAVAPLRLAEPSVALDPDQPQTLGRETCPTLLARFAPGSSALFGADDWQVIYIDPKSGLANALARIAIDPVRHALGQRDCAITYYGFKDLDGVVIPTRWQLWRWEQDLGIHGLPQGAGRVYNLETVYPARDAFTPPPGARAVN